MSGAGRPGALPGPGGAARLPPTRSPTQALAPQHMCSQTHTHTHTHTCSHTCRPPCAHTGPSMWPGTTHPRSAFSHCPHGPTCTGHPWAPALPSRHGRAESAPGAGGRRVPPRGPDDQGSSPEPHGTPARPHIHTPLFRPHVCTPVHISAPLHTHTRVMPHPVQIYRQLHPHACGSRAHLRSLTYSCACHGCTHTHKWIVGPELCTWGQRSLAKRVSRPLRPPQSAPRSEAPVGALPGAQGLGASPGPWGSQCWCHSKEVCTCVLCVLCVHVCGECRARACCA